MKPPEEGDEVAQRDPDEPFDDESHEGCDAEESECSFVAPEHDPSTVETPEADGEVSPHEEVVEPFPIERTDWALSGEDSLPVPVSEAEHAVPPHAPSFTRDKFVCADDDSEYVEMFKHELTPDAGLALRPEEGTLAVRPPDSIRSVVGLGCNDLALRSGYDDEGSPVGRRSWPREAVNEMWGHHWVRENGKLTPVRPRRERCKYYRRQMYASHTQPVHGEPGHLQAARVCLARRSVGGAFLSLRDEGIYACDLRDPPDQQTTHLYLDAPDARRLDAGEPEMVAPFGLGIFDRR